MGYRAVYVCATRLKPAFGCKIQVQDWCKIRCKILGLNFLIYSARCKKCKIFGSLKLCSDIFSAQRYLNII